MASRILGPDGQPIDMGILREPQTSHVQQLRTELQNHPSRGLTPSRLAAILDAAEQGDIVGQSELYEDMEEKDAHIASEMGKRRRALVSLDWDIVPPTSPYAREKAAAARLKELLAGLPSFEDMLFDATDAIGKGFACLEVEWHRVDGLWLPKSITHRPQAWFQIHRGATQEIRLRDNSAEGAVLRPFGWIVPVHRAKSGYVERAALFRVLVWPYLFKTYSVGDLAEFLEIYGVPLRVGKYPPGASEKEKMTLLRALTELGHNAAGIMPDSMRVEFEAAAKGDPDAFELMIDYCERAQSKAILGGTLTSQADGKTSTNALGTVHDEIRKDLRDGDARQIAAALSRDLIYPIAALNGLAQSALRAPRLHFPTEDTEDMTAYADALPKLLGIGMRIPRKWAQEKIGIPEPEADDDDLLAMPAAAPAPVAATTRMTARAAAARTDLPAAERDPDYLDALAAQMADRAGGSVEAWFSAIRAEVQAARTHEELLGRLSLLLAELPLDTLAAALGEGFATAALAGAADARDDADA